MTVTEIKHQAHLKEWHDRILECRSSGVSVKQWCRENQFNATTYYRWEREIFGKAKQERSEEASIMPAVTFAELTVSAPREPQSSDLNVLASVIATVRVGNAEVEIYSGADTKIVEALCKALNYVK